MIIPTVSAETNLTAASQILRRLQTHPQVDDIEAVAPSKPRSPWYNPASLGSKVNSITHAVQKKNKAKCVSSTSHCGFVSIKRDPDFQQ